MRYRLALSPILIALLIISFASPFIVFSPVYAASEVTFYSSKDNNIEDEAPDTNFGNEVYMIIGGREAEYGEHGRGLVEFTINWGTDIPSNAVITSATLQLYYMNYEWNNPAGRTVYAQRLLRLTWTETGSNWNKYKSGSSWTTAGAGSLANDYTNTGQASTTVPSSEWSWMSFNVLTQTQWAQTNNKNVAMRIVQASEALDYSFFIATRQYGSSTAPKLIIDYCVPPSLTTDSATSVLNTTATLEATITSIGGCSVTTRGFQYGLTQTPTWDTHETGSFGVGSYTLDISGLSAGTQYWFRGYATNAAGTTYGSWVSFTTKDYPAIATVDASNVAGSSARLNSALESDGGDDCTINFGWGLTSESDIEDYDSSETLPDTYNTGAYPYLDVSGLLSGYTYYFRVSATNIMGTDLGDELTFETPIVLEAPTNFVGYPEATSISLSWSRGSGSTNTLVRYGSTTYPTTITSGTYAYSGPSTTYTLEGLSSGKTYYISAWGETGGNYSATYATLLMTTSASAGTDTADIDVPTQPSRWFSAPDYTGMAGLGILYDAYNAALDTGHVPRETGWFLGALGLAFLAGLIAYLKLGKKLMIGMIAMTVVLAMGYFMKLVPFWVPLMMLILVIVFSQSHKQADQG